MKKAIGTSLQEMSSAVEVGHRAQNSFMACQESKPTQWRVIQKKLYATVKVTT